MKPQERSHLSEKDHEHRNRYKETDKESETPTVFPSWLSSQAPEEWFQKMHLTPDSYTRTRTNNNITALL